MANKDAVVWYEGMFMRQQHLQQHTRYVEGLVSDSIHSNNRFAWGFAALELDTSDLAHGLLGVNSARGILPDSTPFSFDANSGSPARIDVSKQDPGSLVYLCLGQRDGGRHKQEYSQGEVKGISTRFQTYHSEVLDSAAEIGSIQDSASTTAPAKPGTTQLVLGQLNLQLMTDSDESKHLVRLPVARLSDVVSNVGAQLDQEFVPPVTDIQASPRVRQYVREVRGVVSSRAGELANTVGDLVTGAEFSPNILWLMLANRYDSLFSQLMPTGVHPAELYRILVELLGESSTFTSSTRRPDDLPTYNHANLAESLGPLVELVTQNWSHLTEDIKELPLQFLAKHNMWAWKIKDHNMFGSYAFVLAAKANLTEDELADQLPELMIVAPIEEIDERVSDFQLAVAKIKPKGVPALNRWTYFHIEPKRKDWRDMMESRALAFFVDRLEHDFSELSLRLWAVPEG